MFSLLLRGSKDVLLKIKGQHIELEKRRNYRNDFAPVFYGQVEPWGSGTRIQGYFDVPLFARFFMPAWFSFAIVFAAILLISTLGKIIGGDLQLSGDDLIAFLAAMALVLFGIWFPRFGKRLAEGEEEFVTDFLQSTLIGRLEYPPLSAEAEHRHMS